jgi:hypothetical protein
MVHRITQLALVALACIIPMAAAAPAASASDVVPRSSAAAVLRGDAAAPKAKSAMVAASTNYLHQWEGCGLESGMTVTYAYGPTTGGPPADTALYHNRANVRNEWRSQGGDYYYGRLTFFSRFSNTNINCRIHHYSKNFYGVYCDYEYNVNGTDASRTVEKIGDRYCGFSTS